MESCNQKHQRLFSAPHNYVKQDFYELGLCYYDKKEFAKALDIFEFISNNFKGPNPNIWVYIGVIKSQMGNYSDSIIIFSNIIDKIDPHNIHAYFNRGLSKLISGDFHGAINDFTTIIENLSNKHVGAWINRGNAYTKLDNFHEAINNYSYIIDHLDDKNEHAWFNRALAYTFINNYHQSISDLTFIIRNINNKDEKYWMLRGNSFLGLERYDEAIEDYNYVLEKCNTTDSEALFKRSVCYFFLENYEKAQTGFSFIINNLNKNHLDSWNNLGSIHYKKGEYGQAIDVFNHVIENIDQKSQTARFNKGLCLEELRKHKEAIDEFSFIIENIDSQNISAWLNRGYNRSLLMHYKDAISDFSFIINCLDKGYMKAYLQRGINHGHLKEYAKAIQDFTYIIENIDNSNLDARHSRGMGYANLKKYNSALQDFNFIINNIDNISIKTLFARARVYLDVNRQDSCLNDMNRILEIDNTNLHAYRYIQKELISESKNNLEFKLYGNRIRYLIRDINKVADEESNIGIINQLYSIFDEEKEQIFLNTYVNYLRCLSDINKNDNEIILILRILYLFNFILDRPHLTFTIIDEIIDVGDTQLSFIDHYYFIISGCKNLESKETILNLINIAYNDAVKSEKTENNEVEEYFKRILLKLWNKSENEIFVESNYYPYYSGIRFDSQNIELEVLLNTLISTKNQPDFTKMPNLKYEIVANSEFQYFDLLYRILAIEFMGFKVEDVFIINPEEDRKFRQKVFKHLFSKKLKTYYDKYGGLLGSLTKEIDINTRDDSRVLSNHVNKVERYSIFIKNKLNSGENLESIIILLLEQYSKGIFTFEDWINLSIYAYYIKISKYGLLSENIYIEIIKDEFIVLGVESLIGLYIDLPIGFVFGLSFSLPIALQIFKISNRKRLEQLNEQLDFIDFKEKTISVISENKSFKNNLERMRYLTAENQGIAL